MSRGDSDEHARDGYADRHGAGIRIAPVEEGIGKLTGGRLKMLHLLTAACGTKRRFGAAATGVITATPGVRAPLASRPRRAFSGLSGWESLG